jgi:hypothetical protein
MATYNEIVEDGIGMMDNVNVLVNNSEQFEGKYVALPSFWEKDPVCSGDNPADVYHDAKVKGIEEPVVFFVPREGEAFVY